MTQWVEIFICTVHLLINCAGLLWKREGKFYFCIFPQMFYLTEFKIVFVYLLIKHNCLSGSILLEIFWTNNLLWVKIRIPFDEKFGNVEQDCYGAQGTDWNFSQNWGFELKIQIKTKKNENIKIKRQWRQQWIRNYTYVICCRKLLNQLLSHKNHNLFRWKWFHNVIWLSR
jgi:hypothetical protein